MKDDNVYIKVLRVGAGLSAIALWVVSVQFSVTGFSITLPDMAWIGWTLAIVVTILQLIFNKGVYKNPTLFFSGILAYLYGITTNIIGIMRAQEILDNLLSSFTDDLGFYLPRTFMSIILAMVIEIIPEALFLWAIFMDKVDVGDFISSVFQGTNLSKKKDKFIQKNVQQNVPKSVHGHVQGQDRTPLDNFVPSRTDFVPSVPSVPGVGQAQDSDTRAVLSIAIPHRQKHGSFPSVRDLEHKTGVSKTKVAEILKPFRK